MRLHLSGARAKTETCEHSSSARQGQPGGPILKHPLPRAADTQFRLHPPFPSTTPASVQLQGPAPCSRARRLSSACCWPAWASARPTTRAARGTSPASAAGECLERVGERGAARRWLPLPAPALPLPRLGGPGRVVGRAVLGAWCPLRPGLGACRRSPCPPPLALFRGLHHASHNPRIARSGNSIVGCLFAGCPRLGRAAGARRPCRRRRTALHPRSMRPACPLGEG